jgi:hypothetical protein
VFTYPPRVPNTTVRTPVSTPRSRRPGSNSVPLSRVRFRPPCGYLVGQTQSRRRFFREIICFPKTCKTKRTRRKSEMNKRKCQSCMGKQCWDLGNRIRTGTITTAVTTATNSDRTGWPRQSVMPYTKCSPSLFEAFGMTSVYRMLNKR